MSTSADRPEENSVLLMLHDIRHEQTRQGTKLDDIARRVTGGDDLARGLEHQVLNLRSQVEEERESRTFWFRNLGLGVLGSVIASVWALLVGHKQA